MANKSKQPNPTNKRRVFVARIGAREYGPMSLTALLQVLSDPVRAAPKPVTLTIDTREPPAD